LLTQGGVRACARVARARAAALRAPPPAPLCARAAALHADAFMTSSSAPPPPPEGAAAGAPDGAHAWSLTDVTWQPYLMVRLRCRAHIDCGGSG
jgi:hypothetical protein